MAKRYGGGATTVQVATFAKKEAASGKKNATSSSGTARASAVGSGTSATQLDWSHLIGTQSLILIAVALSGLALAAHFTHRSRTQQARSKRLRRRCSRIMIMNPAVLGLIGNAITLIAGMTLANTSLAPDDIQTLASRAVVLINIAWFAFDRHKAGHIHLRRQKDSEPC